MIRDIRIKAWSDLDREFFDRANAWRDDVGRLRTKCVFRGLPDSTFLLKTTLKLMAEKCLVRRVLSLCRSSLMSNA